MTQNIPKAWNALLAFCITAAAAALRLGELLGLLHNTKAAIQADVDAAEKAQSECQTAISARETFTNAQNETSAKVAAFITIVRELLKPKLGVRYSRAWNEVGFINQNLRVPTKVGEQLGLLRMIALFFEAHPELEVAGVATAAIANGLATTFAADQSALNEALVTIREKKAARDAARIVLWNRVRSLLAELKHLIPANDPRWLDFGFNVPADITVPTAPQGLTLTFNASAHLVANWGDTANTDRFRVYKRVVGTDTEYVPLDSTTNTSFDLGTFASGAHVDVKVTAINAAGESQASETVEIVVP
jgi:hypothetical protein